ncbi:MAG: hypothetical protein LBH31_10350, partial [Burkholderiaceae bacterium]|nr:hypothetical protein [Burkholderiaceae bacterium]
GDLNGQLWRFDLTGGSASPTLLANLTDASGAAQPVTSAPLIEIDPATGKRFVLVGTGRLLGKADVASTQVQDFYVIVDGTNSGFSSASAPLTRGELTPQTDLTAAITFSKGWYYDLGSPNTNYVPPTNPDGTANRTNLATQGSGYASSGTGERVVMQGVAYNGVVAFATQLTTPDQCVPEVGNLYAINFGTGHTAFTDNSIDIPQSSVVASMAIVSTSNSGGGVSGGGGGVNSPTPPCLPGQQCNSNPCDLLSGDQNGGESIKSLNCSGGLGGSAVKLLNWRNVPVNGN